VQRFLRQRDQISQGVAGTGLCSLSGPTNSEPKFEQKKYVAADTTV
jgi:hypothetical protein